MDNVNKVVEKEFCIGCGMCEVICPQNAIEIKFSKTTGQFLPVINDEKCTNCKKCIEICSGLQVDHLKLNKLKGYNSQDAFIGKFEKIQIANSNKIEFLKNCASGGVTTQILMNLFDDNAIDAALVVKQLRDDITKSSVSLIHSKEELLTAQRSMYFNAPLCTKLSEVIESDIRLAIVALPCHLHSILKSYPYLPALKKRIKFVLGLICGGTYKQTALDGLLKKNNIEKDKIKKIDFRYGKWPGKMRIELKNGKVFNYKRDHFFKTNYLKRCFFCYDLLNEHADISIGDNWLRSDGKGENIIIVRNPDIEKYMQNIEIKNVNPVTLYRSHRLLSRRQKFLRANVFAAKLFGWKIPVIIADKQIKSKFKNYLHSLLEATMFSMSGENESVVKRFLKLKGFIDHYFIKNSFWRAMHTNPIKKNKIKIMITEADVTGNKGAVAMLQCIIKQIREKIPDAEFVVTSQHVNKHENFENVKILHKHEQTMDISLIKIWMWWIFKKIGIQLNFLLKDKMLKHYFTSDIIISTSGISFIDEFGLIRVYHFTKFLQIPLLMEKKIIKFTQSFGPFKSVYNIIVSKQILKNVDLIFSRGYHSTQHLTKIGIKNNVLEIPDIAFTLQKEKTERAKKNILQFKEKKIIGISPNIVCKKLDEHNIYVNELIALSNYIIENTDNVLLYLLPHSIVKDNAGKDDDLEICRKIFSEINSPKDCFLDETLDYSPQETKWIISQFEFFIGSRFHSVIAAVSSYVPTLTIGWHWKYEETTKWLGFENSLIQIWEMKQKNIIDYFKANYNKRNELKQKLKDRVPELQKLSLTAIDKIIEELEK